MAAVAAPPLRLGLLGTAEMAVAQPAEQDLLVMLVLPEVQLLVPVRPFREQQMAAVQRLVMAVILVQVRQVLRLAALEALARRVLVGYQVVVDSYSSLLLLLTSFI